jgi:hypothetical protein
VDEGRPGEIVSCAGQAAGLEVFHNHPQVAQAKGLGAS